MPPQLPDPPAHQPRTARLDYVDRVRTALVAAVIVGHSAMSYTDDVGGWPYQDHREVTLPSAAVAVLGLPVAVIALFAMGLLFLLAGAFSVPSLAARGRRRFLTGRLLRLGGPFVVFTLAGWPLLIWILGRVDGDRRTLWQVLLHQRPAFDNGPLWFVGVLLIFSVGYALVGDVRPPAPPAGAGGVRGWHVAAVAAAVAGASFAVRLVWPLDSGQPFNLHLWQWPQCAALFWFGILAGRRGWLAAPLPRRLCLGCGAMALAAVVVLLGVVAGAGDDDVFAGGPHWQSAVVCAAEGAVCIGAALFTLYVFQRRTARPGRIGALADRASYHAYLLHAPVLIGLALALRPVPAPAVVKLVGLAVFGVALSYCLAAGLGAVPVRSRRRPAGATATGL